MCVAEIHQVFIRALQGLWGPNDWVAWPPGERLEIGDVGVVDDALAIGHEVGHLVERDLALTPTLRALLVRALGDGGAAHLPAWERWLAEIFADVYGCLAAGPAYAARLLDLLADASPIDSRAACPDGSASYPPDRVRASLLLACIEGLGFESDASSLRAEWSSVRRDAGSTAFEADVGRVVEALLEGTYPALGGSVRSIVSFTPLEHEAAVDEAERLLGGQVLAVRDIRILVAAGAHAFRSDPRTFRSDRVGGRVLDRAVELRQKGVRRGAGGMPVAAQVRAADEESGRRLFDRLVQRH
jgi:hypothetical protein